MIGFILSYFGYAKVPREAILLCVESKNRMLRGDIASAEKGFEALEKCLRSACYFNEGANHGK